MRTTYNAVMASLYDDLHGFTVFRHNNTVKACNTATYIEYRLLHTEKAMQHAAKHFSLKKYKSMVQEQCFVFFIIPAELMGNNPYKHKIPVGWGTFSMDSNKPEWKLAAPNIKDYTYNEKTEK